MDDIVSSSSYKGNFCIDSDLTEDNFGPAAGATEAKPESVKTTHVDIDLSLDNWETGDDETEAVLNNEYATIEDDRTTNAFTKLQQSMAENEAWNESNTEWKSVSRGKGTRRKAPFYKVLQGMPIAVDAFCYGSIPGITAYFLTHAHSDHYTNLSSTWKHGPIYCSEGTSNLIIHMLSVDPKWVHPLPLDTPPTFKSNFIGSSNIFRYLHCGDFRASPQHVLHSCVKGKKIDHVYLDTTYLDPKYTFPPQALVISACAEMAKRLVEKQPLMDTKNSVGSWLKVKQPDAEKSSESAEKVLVVVGTYSIGKERIVKAIAKALNSKVYCDKKKAAILRCQADSELDALLTSDPLAAMVHVAPLGIINMDGLINYMQRYKNVFTRAIGFKPTGWCFTPSVRNATQILSVPSILSRTQQQSFSHKELRPTRNSSGSVQLIPVPYSEHSSFNELTCFAMSIDWFKIIPTVNIGSEISRKKMSMWIGKWEAERKKRKTSIVPHRHSEYW
ncbi:DNA repair metallo-beta-lactamase-domain-containing protein [Cyathus striatus]|nr:DNA repair metallo-beta-lactamase-domain-containing protein [Cyathus striatus]